MREIWSAAGVGPSRQAVMARAPGPKTYLFGRAGDAPAACAFVACDREVAMLHALEVSPPFRRQGLGMALARAAVAWAADQGARTCALAVAVANAPARSAYDRLGMTQVAAYHYRLAPEQAVYP
jgi:GNAT superfamily N-acetyltransferase